MKNRESWIDVLKGIGIILVCLGHIQPDIYLEKHIYSFHMPLFFFISGYLFISKGNIRDTLKRKFNGLIKPYFVFALLSAIVGLVIDTRNIKEIVTNFFYIDGSVGWNSPIWFLIVLFLVDIIYYLVEKQENKLMLNFSVILIAVVGYFVQAFNIILPFGLHIVPVAITFYYLGVLFKKYNIKETLEKNKIVILVISLAVNIIFADILNTRVSIYHMDYGNYLYFYIASMAGIIFYSTLSIWISKNNILELFGRNSLVLLGTQYFIFKVYSIVGDIIGIKLQYSGNTIISLIMLGLTLAIYFIGIKIVINLKKKYKISLLFISE